MAIKKHRKYHITTNEYLSSRSSINKYEVNQLGTKIAAAPKKTPTNIVELNEAKNKTVTSLLFHDTQAGITNNILGSCTEIFQEGDNEIVHSIEEYQNIGIKEILALINGNTGEPGTGTLNSLREAGNIIIRSTVDKAGKQVETLTTQLESELKSTLDRGLQSVMHSVTEQLGKGFLGGIVGNYVSELLKNCIEDINGRLELGLAELKLPIAKLLVSRQDRLSPILSRHGIQIKDQIDMKSIDGVGSMIDRQVKHSSCWGNVGAAPKLTSIEQDPYTYGNYRMTEKNHTNQISQHINTALNGFDHKIQNKTNILGTLQNKEDIETSRTNSAQNLTRLTTTLNNFLERQLEELSSRWEDR